MVNYLYKAVVYHTTTDVIGIDVATENANKLDFETNYKSLTVPVDDLELMDTVFVVLKTYVQFKELIDGINILWTDVKLETASKFYDLYLLVQNPL